jgi:hypothetical protein
MFFFDACVAGNELTPIFDVLILDDTLLDRLSLPNVVPA